MNIWTFQDMLTRRLSAWARISIGLGLVGLIAPREFWRGMASQFLGWGVINQAIAFFGSQGTKKRLANLDKAEKKAIEAQETQKLAKILWINAGLDVGYVLFGAIFARSNRYNSFKVGAGIGIIVQGLFLLFFVWIHANQLKKGNYSAIWLRRGINPTGYNAAPCEQDFDPSKLIDAAQKSDLSDVAHSRRLQPPAKQANKRMG